ncbi:MAG: hypothetical protein ACTSR2_14505 [Candidatus Hodarchaeales archaeon]
MCEQIIEDEAGMAVGVLNREIGGYRIKFMLLFNNRTYKNIKPLFKVTMKEIEECGFDNFIQKVGIQTISEIRLKRS